jgi:hypothetical protein
MQEYKSAKAFASIDAEFNSLPENMLYSFRIHDHRYIRTGQVGQGVTSDEETRERLENQPNQGKVCG